MQTRCSLRHPLMLCGGCCLHGGGGGGICRQYAQETSFTGHSGIFFAMSPLLQCFGMVTSPHFRQQGRPGLVCNINWRADGCLAIGSSGWGSACRFRGTQVWTIGTGVEGVATKSISLLLLGSGEETVEAGESCDKVSFKECKSSQSSGVGG